MSPPRWMLYGATGYTGKLIAAAAREAGLEPTLAGRDASKVRALAEPLGLPWVAFGLDDPATVDRHLDGHAFVLHAAGPFAATSAPMVDACLRTSTHYMDLTGEAPVVSAVLARNEEARARDVLLVPGVGCDVVPSNCLATALAAQMPDAMHLELVCNFSASPSRGTLNTIIEQIPHPGLIIRDGRLEPVRHGKHTRRFELDGRRHAALAAPWGDLPAAFHATGIPNVTVSMSLPGPLVAYAQAFGWAAPMAGHPWIQSLLRRAAASMPEGPDAATREGGRLTWWGEIMNADGRRLTGRADIPDPYSFTVLVAMAAVESLGRGVTVRGAVPPARAFGTDFLTTIPGCRLVVEPAGA